jgi:hypothetical protein
MSVKSSNDTIGNRSRDLPAFRAAPQSTAPPRAPFLKSINIITRRAKNLFLGRIIKLVLKNITLVPHRENREPETYIAAEDWYHIQNHEHISGKN